MRVEPIGKPWGSAIHGAFWLGLSMVFVGMFGCAFAGSTNLIICVACGALFGLATPAVFLWMFHRYQITAEEVWIAIGDTWNAIGKL